ncbi:MAG: LytTR family transcriptional regulator [Reyranella sp.]|jgi:hypothetical protein|nr:LytTR family transcriptional regulator [Reyranella sp.]MBL6650728.1 LytTR family transcriptional regulator [Reyranella sp.]
MTDNGPRPVDWRLPAIWAALLAVSVVVRTYVAVADQARTRSPISYGDALAIEITSHLVIAALLPALYWLQRRWPLSASARPLLIHVAAVVPFSIVHTVGMAALRLLWFSAILGKPYSFPLTADRLAYEFAKDIVSYIMLSAGIVALHHILQRFPPVPAEPAAVEPSPSPPESVRMSLPERFAVRKRGKEIMVEVADIDWVEAAGNYAVLHVGGDTLEIRSSLTKLEGELDPKRFVRVHKSYVVNVSRIAEVTPWISGDWRIRLQDGAEVNLSRRYRQRFEALVPVRS